MIDFWKYFMPSREMIGVVIGMIVSIIVFAIPIVQGTISDRLSEYNNKHILRMYTKERTYKAIMWLIGLLIIVLIVSFFFNADENAIQNRVIAFMVLISGIIAIIVFYFFIHRTNDYTVNTDDVVFEYCKRQLKEMNYDISNFDNHMEMLQMCGNVIEHKIKLGNNEEIENVCKIMEDAIIKIFKSVKIHNNEGFEILEKESKAFYDIYYKLWKRCYKSAPETAYILLKSYTRVFKNSIDLMLI